MGWFPPSLLWNGGGDTIGGGGRRTENRHLVSPPPGLVRGGGWGPLKLQLEKRPGVTDKAGIVRKPYASHKSYSIAQ